MNCNVSGVTINKFTFAFQQLSGNYNNSIITVSSSSVTTNATLFGTTSYFLNVSVIIATLNVNGSSFSLLSNPNATATVINCSFTAALINCSVGNVLLLFGHTNQSVVITNTFINATITSQRSYYLTDSINVLNATNVSITGEIYSNLPFGAVCDSVASGFLKQIKMQVGVINQNATNGSSAVLVAQPFNQSAF